MKLWIRSDLHCSLRELADSFDGAPDHDVAVLAGDLAGGLQSQIEAIDSVASRTVVLVAGNHEFWRRSHPAEVLAAEIAARRSRHVRFLERSSCMIGGTRFVGGTLWTDFCLYGADAKSLGMAHAQAHNFDFQSIYADLSGIPGQARRLFTPDDARRLHAETKKVIEEVCERPHDGPTVVVSHHAPDGFSVEDEWKRDPGTPAYASRLGPFIQRLRPELWIHGHVHNSARYKLEETHVVCNPKGFHDENGAYDPDLVVEV